MPNTEALTQALGGANPQQAQKMTSTLINALQNQQQIENTQNYKQQRLNIAQQREQRLAEQARFDRNAKILTMKIDKQMKSLKKDLMEKRGKLTDVQRKYKNAQYNQLQNKAKTLRNMNQKINIPGAGDTIKAGAAVQAGIFGDLVQENAKAAGMTFDDFPPEFKELLSLETKYPDMKEDELLRRSGLTGDKLGDIIKIMGIMYDDPKTAVKKWRQAKEAAQNTTLSGNSGGFTSSRSTSSRSTSSNTNSTFSDEDAISQSIKEFKENHK